MGVLKDGSRRYGNRMPAIVATQQRGSHRRTLAAPTARTMKTFRPTQQAQVLAAIFIAAKARVELLQVPRIVFHAPEYYGLWHGESSGYQSTPILLVCCVQANLDIALRGIENLRLAAEKITRHDGTTDVPT